ncbi:hypothetical protein ACHWQZ_G014515 [Mnemiopsis leidyi]
MVAKDVPVPVTKAVADKKEDKDKKDKKEDDIPEETPDEELSEEDRALKEDLEMLVTRLKEKDQSLYAATLEAMGKSIRSATSSMTSVPKPLKFLRPHYTTFRELYETWPEGADKKTFADVLSVLSMTNPDQEEKATLKYRMQGAGGEIGHWGHEYVRHISGEIGRHINEPDTNIETRNALVALSKEIVAYDMTHNTESEACDLLMEIECLDVLEQFVDSSCYERVCLYLISCVPYVPEPEDKNLLKTALNLYYKFEVYPLALRCAVQLNDMDLVQEVFSNCKDPAVQKQLAFILGRQQLFLELDEEQFPDAEELMEIMSNVHLNTNFQSLARELDIMEPKVPEDIYKSHLENVRPYGPTNVDSARQNLAASFVNGFVNCAFGNDKLLAENGNKWLYKNKEHGMMSATASLGLILLWDVDGGLTQIDKYLYSSEDYIKCGALLACGIVNSGVRNECDPALALLSDYVLHQSNNMRIGSIVGLGLAYAGSNREDVIELLLPVLSDSNSTLEVIGQTALALGMVAIASCHGEVTSTILQTMMDKSETELKDTHSRFLALGLALTYLGKQEEASPAIEALKVVGDPLGKMAATLVEVVAYAGTGDVLKIQKMLHLCSEHYEVSRDDNKKDKKEKQEADAKKLEAETGIAQQMVAVIGIALIAMAEELGAEMALRSYSNLLRYGEPCIRRVVPLALAMLSASNPKLEIIDTLSKLSHDSDSEVAHNAIFAMGIVGSGTNNARLANMLRQLAQYYHKDANNLFMVRLAQGLVHLGKGTLTLSPYHSDRMLMSRVAVGGLLGVIVAFMDVNNLIIGKSHYLLYHLVSAIQPRMLVTFNEDLKPLPVPVRVGQAVDVVGQAGKPKTITGFQTHTTPVLLAHGERAELGTNEYTPLTPVMEGFVILRKNEDMEE